jgi:hypothetical protein
MLVEPFPCSISLLARDSVLELDQYLKSCWQLQPSLSVSLLLINLAD